VRECAGGGREEEEEEEEEHVENEEERLQGREDATGGFVLIAPTLMPTTTYRTLMPTSGKLVSPPSSTSDRYRKNVRMRGPAALFGSLDKGGGV
jgi:hypothetical protein